MEWTPQTGERQYAEFVAAAAGSLVGFDMDGTLAPIVDDPTTSRIHRDLPDVLLALAPHVGTLAVITGRPARQAIAIGSLDDLGTRVEEAGRELVVLGQYGNERWTSRERRIVSPRPPAGLASFEQRLPRLLRAVGHPDAYVEEKGLAVAVHTRRLAQPQAAYDALLAPITSAAQALGLAVEPGKQVIEVRAPGVDKGTAIRSLVAGHSGVFFAGDDLGDAPAFEAVQSLRREGLPSLLAFVGTDPHHPLASLADVRLDGPQGVLALLRRLLADLSR